MKLTAAETQSALWIKTRDHYEQHLSELRESNDYPLSELDTAWKRGRISAIKEFLEMGKPDPEPPAEHGELEF